MDMISVGIVGLVFILLVVFAVLSAKSWHWANIVFVILTFLAGVGASIGMAQVFELRHKAMKLDKQQEERAEKAEADYELALNGRPDSTEYDRESLRGITQRLALAMMGRGRVWSGGQVTVEDKTRKFQFATARPADADNQNKLTDVLLYAFADGIIGDQPYPQSYIGAVLVSAETPESVTLQPEFIANVQEWAEPSASWSLFEKMPLDRRGIFKEGVLAFVAANQDGASEPMKKLAESIEKDELDIGLFRQVLTSQYLKAEPLGVDPKSAEYEALVDRYAFDGESLGKIQNWIDANAGSRVSPRFEPSPEEVFVRFKFDKASSKSYKVDADGQTLETDGSFTGLGEAIDTALHAGKQLEFSEGDTVLVDQRTAEGYEIGEKKQPAFSAEEAVTEIDRVFIREVRDYPYLLSDYATQTQQLAFEANRVRENNLIQTKAFEDTQTQLADRQNTTAGLEKDGGNLKNDLDTVSALLAKRQEETQNISARIDALQSEIQKFYEKIQQLARAAEQKAFAGN